jgi:hypothetical protein
MDLWLVSTLLFVSAIFVSILKVYSMVNCSSKTKRLGKIMPGLFCVEEYKAME